MTTSGTSHRRRRVLVVTHVFPPSAESGVHRTLGFVRHLPRNGWDPVVLTVRGPVGSVWDPELLSQVPEGVPVVRTPWLDIRLAVKRVYLALHDGSLRRTKEEVLSAPVAEGAPVRRLRRWLIPDDAIGWVPFAVRAGSKAIRMRGVDAIYSTAPPPSAHLVARALKGLTGVPWVADFRDLWTQNPYRDMDVGSRLGLWRTRVERRLEASVLSSADAILTISDSMRSSLAKGRDVPVHVITNGYEPREIRRHPRSPQDPFTVCFTGSFYAREYSPFLGGLRRFLDEAALGPADVQARFFGASCAELQDPVDRSGLATIVCLSPPVPHSQALQEQAGASILLLVVDQAGGMQGRMTGKVFEYLQAKRPILAIAPFNSEVAALVRSTGAGVVVSPTTDDVATALKKFYREFEVTGEVAWHGDQTRIETYSRPKLADRLAKILDSVVESRDRGLEGLWRDEP